MILKVARLGHPVLRGRAKSVTAGQIASPEFQQLLDDMVETMHEYDGVGLAAPQVHVGLAVAVLEVADNPRSPRAEAVPLTFLINPKLTMVEQRNLDDWEGCLSIPEFRGRVPRFTKLKVSALDRQGKRFETVAEGFHARVIQHEADHLEGNVYLDRMTDMRTLSHLAEWHRFAHNASPAKR